MLSPHPPQIHSFFSSFGFLVIEQPHDVKCPSLHPLEMLCTTPADAIALANAASFDANTK